MIKLLTCIAVASGALLLSGTAFASPMQPAAGNGPFVGPAYGTAMHSTLQRRDVEADAALHMPADGRFNAQGAPLPPSTLTRAQVRGQLLDAVAHGFRIGAHGFRIDID